MIQYEIQYEENVSLLVYRTVDVTALHSSAGPSSIRALGDTKCTQLSTGESDITIFECTWRQAQGTSVALPARVASARAVARGRDGERA